MIVGNPYVDPYTNTITMFQAWYSRGLLPWPLYHKCEQKCHKPQRYFAGVCLDYIREMYRICGKGINIYALDFPVCTSNPIEEEQGHPQRGQRRRRRGGPRQAETNQGLNTEQDHERLLYDVDTNMVITEKTGNDHEDVISSQATHLMNSTLNAISDWNSNNDDDDYGHRESNDPPFLNTGNHYYPCAKQDLIQYLNRRDVMKAIHANIDTPPWKPCTNRVNYSTRDSTMIPQMTVYGTLLGTMDEGTVNLDMMIFSGDDDSVCSLSGTQSWIWNLGFHPDGTNHYWVPWTVSNQTAGYLTQFQLRNPKSSFIFATVDGAGHEVPSYMPREALYLFQRYLQQDWDL